jgi:hypothetical protein
MTNRVVIGQKGAEYGLWVSPTGVDVLTAPDSSLLFSMSGALLQVLQSGTFSVSSASVNIPISADVGTGRPYARIFTLIAGTWVASNGFFEASVTNTTLTVSVVGGNPDNLTYNGAYLIISQEAV